MEFGPSCQFNTPSQLRRTPSGDRYVRQYYLCHQCPALLSSTLLALLCSAQLCSGFLALLCSAQLCWIYSALLSSAGSALLCLAMLALLSSAQLCWTMKKKNWSRMCHTILHWPEVSLKVRTTPTTGLRPVLQSERVYHWSQTSLNRP